MDDEDGRCLLDVICDPQALNDFLHGSEKLDSDDLLDNPGEAQNAFYEGPGLHVQEASGNHLNPEPSQPAPSVDLDFLEDDILDSPPAPGQMNGTVDHPPPPPAAADRKPPQPAPHCPRLPLRKTYRENVEAPGVGVTEGAAAAAVGRARGGSPAPLPTKVDEATSGLIRELAAVEDELYQRMLKAGPADPAAGTGQGSGSREPGWEAPPLPPAKRRKSESPDVDQASFSSDSPQDDTLTEHLQSAIDSILNLQQAPGRTPAPPYSHATPAAVTPTSPTPLHRPEAYPPSSHNGGLGTRTLNR